MNGQGRLNSENDKLTECNFSINVDNSVHYLHDFNCPSVCSKLFPTAIKTARIAYCTKSILLDYQFTGNKLTHRYVRLKVSLRWIIVRPKYGILLSWWAFIFIYPLWGTWLPYFHLYHWFWQHVVHYLLWFSVSLPTKASSQRWRTREGNVFIRFFIECVSFPEWGQHNVINQQLITKGSSKVYCHK